MNLLKNKIIPGFYLQLLVILGCHNNAHLRTRTNTFSAIMRLRSSLSFAVHNYFNSNGFYYVHTPIITSSDAEGAGEQFRVTTLNPKNPPLDENNEVSLILLN